MDELKTKQNKKKKRLVGLLALLTSKTYMLCIDLFEGWYTNRIKRD